MAIIFRQAKEADLPAILRLLSDDILGRGREFQDGVIDEVYIVAFEAFAEDRNNLLIVGIEEETIIGFCQLTFIPGLSRRGSWRAQIESVRVEAARRSNGIGAAMMHHAIQLAQGRGCQVVQLTSDKQRDDAHRFYIKLGFEPTHHGFKLKI